MGLMAVSSLDPNHEQKGFVNVQYLKNTMSTLHTFSFFLINLIISVLNVMGQTTKKLYKKVSERLEGIQKRFEELKQKNRKTIKKINNLDIWILWQNWNIFFYLEGSLTSIMIAETFICNNKFLKLRKYIAKLTLSLGLLLVLSIRSPVLEWEGCTLTEGGSKEMVFLRPLFVVPGILGPTIEEVYLIISVSGGNLTPPKIELGSL